MDGFENALDFASDAFRGAAAAVNATSDTRVFDARVTDAAGRGLNSPLQPTSLKGMTMKITSIAGATVALALSTTAAFAGSCIEMGGVGIPNFYPEGEGQPIIISATLTGTVEHASGKILATRETDTGLEMDMEHYFGRGDGGGFQTRDLGVLTAVPGKPGRYMIEITYDLDASVTRGTLEGYAGQFRSYGLVDLRDEGNLVGLVRYSGEICR